MGRSTMGSGQESKRNCSVDCAKLLYAVGIVIFHSYSKIFKGGYIGVEFFLLASSVFFFMSCERQLFTGKDITLTPEGYFLKRFSRFFPWTFGALLFMAFIQRCVISPISSIGKIADAFVGDIDAIFLVSMNGLSSAPGAGMINGNTWTISSMLLVEFLMFCGMFHFKKRFTGIIIPVSLIIGMGIWRNYEVEHQQTWMGLTAFGTFRAWIIYCAGWYCLKLIKWLNQLRLNIKGKILFTAMECICHICVLVIMIHRSTKDYQWFCTLLFMIAIAIPLSGHSLLNDFLSKHTWTYKVCCFLGEISLSVYLLHGALLSLFTYWYPSLTVRLDHTLQFSGALLLCVLIQWYLTPKIVLLIKRSASRCKFVFTDDSQ